MLRLLDEGCALDTISPARRELGRDIWASPGRVVCRLSWRSPMDVDSGVVIRSSISRRRQWPAFVGLPVPLATPTCPYSTRRSTLPVSLPRNGLLNTCASNQVGDARDVICERPGPMWEKCKAGGSDENDQDWIRQMITPEFFTKGFGVRAAILVAVFAI